MNLSKKNQAGRYSRSGKRKKRAVKLKLSESQIQGQLNDMLEKLGIRYLRITDSFWSWFNQMFRAGKVPDSIYYPFVDTWKGISDTIIMVPDGEKYNKALCLELKTEKGKHSAGQKEFAKQVNVEISRTPDDNVKIVQEFLEEAKNTCQICGCRISLMGYCAGCQTRI